MLDAPPQLNHEVVACVAAAASHYSADPQKAIDRILQRKGASGDVRQTGGRTELGIFGVDESAATNLRLNGLTRQRLKDDDCLNVTIGIYLESAQQAVSGLGNISGAQVVDRGSASASKRLPRLDAQAEQCVDTAAAAYRLPVNVFRAVLRTEGGWTGLKKRNTNGSYDMGPAQINTIHLPDLSRHGITEQMLVHDACINIYVGAYRLRVEIERVGDLWRGVGNYHSRTPHLHQAYLARVRGNL